MKRASLALLSLCWISVAAADPAPLPNPSLPDVQIQRVDSRLVVDGRLDEPIWKTAPAVTNFTQKEPNQGAPGSQQIGRASCRERVYSSV